MAYSYRVRVGLCVQYKNHNLWNPLCQGKCDREEVINKLNKHLKSEKTTAQSIKTSDLINLGITNKAIREYVCQKLHLGVCNQKELIKRIDFLKIDFSEIERVVNEFNGN